MLLSIEKHPKHTYIFLPFRKDLFFFLPVKALLLFLFPWCSLISIPCSCTPTHCKASVPGIPLPQGWIVYHISCLAGSSCCASSHAKFPCHRKNKAYSRGTDTQLTVGAAKTSRAEFLLHKGISCCAESWHSRRIEAGWAKRSLSFALGRSWQLCRKPLLQSSTDLADGACSCWAGRSSHYLCAKGGQADTCCPGSPHTAQCEQEHRVSSTRLCSGLASANPWKGVSDWPVICAWITHSSNKLHRGGWGEEPLPFLSHLQRWVPISTSSTWRYRYMGDDSAQIRQNRVQHKICNPVLKISILHLGAFYSAWSGIENKIKCCGCEPVRFREVWFE